MSPSLSMSSDGKLIYQLNPDLKYRPNNLDSSDYPGKVVYRRSTTRAPCRSAAEPRPAWRRAC